MYSPTSKQNLASPTSFPSFGGLKLYTSWKWN